MLVLGAWERGRSRAGSVHFTQRAAIPLQLTSTALKTVRKIHELAAPPSQCASRARAAAADIFSSTCFQTRPCIATRISKKSCRTFWLSEE
jgi:hypothetical protein